MLAGLGFSEDDFQRPLTELSGGEGTRALLAKLLLESPDLLLLDEPTNHLDLQAIEWLEDWLSDWPGSLVVVAHDRYFLDQVVDRVWDLSFGRLESYPGNYSAYAELKEARMERCRQEYEAQQEFIARTEAFIRRYRAGQRSKEARGRATRLARLERLERLREHRTIHLDIQPPTRSGDLVLASQDLTVGYPSHPPFHLSRPISAAGGVRRSARPQRIRQDHLHPHLPGGHAAAGGACLAGTQCEGGIPAPAPGGPDP